MDSKPAGTIPGLPALGTQQWDDLHFRANFTDTGKYPTPGVLSASPDIVPLGRDPVSDGQYLIDGVNWTTDFGGATKAAEPNYIYLRGDNLSAAATTGRLYLYWSPASLVCWPSVPTDPSKGWAANALKTDRGQPWVAVSAAAGGRFCTPEPFRWIPQPGNDSNYSLIGRIETERHPNPIPTLANISDFAAYISQHPNMAWRNVTTVNPAWPVWTNTVSYDQGAQGGVVYLVMKCEYAPDGSAVALSSSTPGPRPPVHKPKTEVHNEISPDDGVPRFTVVVRSEIPAGWSSEITFSWYSEGHSPLPGMCIQLDAIMLVECDDQVLGAASVPLTDLGIADDLGGRQPRCGIRLGSATLCSTRSAPPG